jgi:hypothetical protein
MPKTPASIPRYEKRTYNNDDRVEGQRGPGSLITF